MLIDSARDSEGLFAEPICGLNPAHLLLGSARCGNLWWAIFARVRESGFGNSGNRDNLKNYYAESGRFKIKNKIILTK